MLYIAIVLGFIVLTLLDAATNTATERNHPARPWCPDARGGSAHQTRRNRISAAHTGHGRPASNARFVQSGTTYRGGP